MTDSAKINLKKNKLPPHIHLKIISILWKNLCVVHPITRLSDLSRLLLSRSMAKLQLFPNLTNSHSGIPPAMLCHHHCPVAALPQDLRLHTTKPRSRRRTIVQYRTSAPPLKTTKFKSNQMSKITRSTTLNNLPDPLVPNLLGTTSPSPRGRYILVAKIKAFGDGLGVCFPDPSLRSPQSIPVNLTLLLVFAFLVSVYLFGGG